MKIDFYKYHGTGNDFIIIDNRTSGTFLKKNQIIRLCDRHFGIGADGLMFIENHPFLDFHMSYYNSDGNESTMCGNGGRCLVAFAKSIGIVSDSAIFNAIDGVHNAIINSDDSISLKMKDIDDIKFINTNYLLNTGSPHYVIFDQNVSKIDVFKKGSEIRNSKEFAPSGVNVNFVEIINDELFVRTYERGVENETLSCGTGVTASAISAAIKLNTDKNSWKIKTIGGKLSVRFDKINSQSFTDIWLTGPAAFVFKGEIDI